MAHEFNPLLKTHKNRLFEESNPFLWLKIFVLYDTEADEVGAQEGTVITLQHQG